MLRYTVIWTIFVPYILYFELQIFNGLNFEHIVQKCQLFEICFRLKIWQKHENSYPKTILRVKELKNAHLFSQIDPLVRFYLASTRFRLLHTVATFLFFRMLEYSKFPISEQKRFVQNIVLIEFFPNYSSLYLVLKICTFPRTQAS